MLTQTLNLNLATQLTWYEVKLQRRPCNRESNKQEFRESEVFVIAVSSSNDEDEVGESLFTVRG